MPVPRFPNSLLKPVFVIQKNKETYSEPSQTSKIELFVKIVDGGWQLVKFAESSILDVWQGFNMLLELRDLFASVFVWDSLNTLTIINLNNVLNILLKIENNSLKQYIAGILYIAA